MQELAAPVRHYCYVVVNPSKPEESPLHFALSRAGAREWLRWQPEADLLRVRRAALKIFES